MLMITRRAGERIVLGGGEVTIEVVEITGGQVRIGIQAPKSVAIYREELWEQIKAENEAAAHAGDLSALQDHTVHT
jgi:carbon storage regulator